ncbi:MAG: hypothetical protein WC441_02915 [Patescibacteria group bacterium]
MATQQENQRQPRQSRVIRLRPDVSLQNGTFHLQVECQVSDNGIAMTNQPVLVKRGLTIIENLTTDQYGVCILTRNGNQANTEQIFIFRFCLAGYAEEAEITVTIPAIASGQANTNDPDRMILSRHHDGYGNFRVHIRVLKHQGQGIAVPVSIWYRGLQHQAQTNNCGEAVFNVPGTLAPGESFPLRATVSGISDAAQLKISRPAAPPHNVPKYTGAWWLGTNNGRALILIILSVLLWIVCAIIGPGEPLINPTTFRNESGLSKQEQLYNNIVKDVDKSYQIPPKEHQNTGHKIWWKLAIIVTLITLVYAPLSLREEVAEGVREGVERMLDKDYARAGDPAFERLIKWVGTYNVARRPQAAQVSTSGGNNEDHGGNSWTKMIGIELLFEAIIHIVPAIFRRAF